ncbi:MAG: YbaN family protein [Defluviitaleaceae bacterium]|nr:YbaN family protein [Defluviitaleaceae bacterium]
MKYVYLVAGLVFLGLGGVGVVLPLIPTTPFVLLAAICFGKSSEKLHKWFISTQFYKNNIEGFVKERTMTIKAKLKLLLTITVFMGFSFFVMRVASAPPVSQIMLAIVWVLHVLYFGFKVKTLRTVPAHKETTPLEH